MNIIWLTPEIPYPPIGGRNGVYHRIVQLSKYNKIYLFSIAYTEMEKASSNEMEKYCTQVRYYNRNENKWNVLLKSIVLPYSVASRTMSDLRRDIAETLSTVPVDVIISDFPNMAMNLVGLTLDGQYLTLNQHNIEFRRMRDMLGIKSVSIFKRTAYYLESLRLECYERWIYRKGLFGSITFFSEDDREFFHKKWRLSDTELKLFPLGADAVDSFPVAVKEPVLLFVGRLDEVALPNVEAALWFVNEVLPKITKVIPEVKVVIAGANPSNRVLSLQNKNVEIIPDYESLETVYSLTDVVILPLLSGGGVKGKLLEAAAFGKKIIATNHGIEGTKFTDRKHVLVANSADDFAKACVDVLSNISSYDKMSRQALELFKSNYDWSVIGKAYNDFLEKRTARRRCNHKDDL